VAKKKKPLRLLKHLLLLRLLRGERPAAGGLKGASSTQSNTPGR